MRALGVVVAAILLTTACTRPGAAHAKASPTPNPSPSSTAPSSVAWSDCGSGFQCGSLMVPLDYSNPSGDTIKLALIRKPATGSGRIGSVVMNPGGPGGSGIDFLRGTASAMKNLNQQFDLVSFDPRGVGQSTSVHCLDSTGRQAFDALNVDKPTEKQAAIQADQNWVRACEQNSGKLLPFVDTFSAARDMDLIRAALGDDKLTYLGFSYGTYLGQAYAHLFPTHIRAFVLDGVVDPNMTPNQMLLDQLKGFQRNLDAFFAWCRSTASCAFGRRGDPSTNLLALLNRLDTTPIKVGQRQLTRSLAVTGVLYGMYNQSFWKYLDPALDTAVAGNGTILLELADFYLGRAPDGSYDNTSEANTAVNCLDRPVPLDIASYDALRQAYAKASPVFGPGSEYSNLICAFWPVKPTGKIAPISVDGAPTLLFVGGTNDPATPYAWAQAVHGEDPGSVLLTRRGDGHVSYFVSTCAQTIEDKYLISLSLPAEGTVCAS